MLSRNINGQETMHEASCGTLSVLIIAINNYRNWKRLECCHSEGDYLSQTIANLHPNAHLRVKKDANHIEMQTELKEFLATTSPKSQKLFFFAGHGVETGQGTFILPSDAPATGEGDILDLASCVSVEAIKKQFRGQPAQGTLGIVLACCRQAVQAAPVRIPLRLQIQRPKSSVIVLHGCEQGIEIDDGFDIVFTPAGESFSVSNLCIACARAFTMA